MTQFTIPRGTKILNSDLSKGLVNFGEGSIIEGIYEVDEKISFPSNSRTGMLKFFAEEKPKVV